MDVANHYKAGDPLLLPTPSEPGFCMLDVAGRPLPEIRLRAWTGPWWERTGWRLPATDVLGHVSIRADGESPRVVLLEPDLAGVRGARSFDVPEDELRDMTLRRVRDVQLLFVDPDGQVLPRLVVDVRPADADDAYPWDPRGTLLVTDDEGTLTLPCVPAERSVLLRTSDPTVRDGSWRVPAEVRALRCEVTPLTLVETRWLARLDAELLDLAELDQMSRPGRAERDERRRELRRQQAEIRKHGLR